VKLQEELKSMPEVGNRFAKDLSEQEQVKWKEQQDILNAQFTSISKEFNNHKTELIGRAARLDLIDAQLKILTNYGGISIKEALNNFVNLKQQEENSNKNITEFNLRRLRTAK